MKEGRGDGEKGDGKGEKGLECRGKDKGQERKEWEGHGI